MLHATMIAEVITKINAQGLAARRKSELIDLRLDDLRFSNEFLTLIYDLRFFNVLLVDHQSHLHNKIKYFNKKMLSNCKK
jgi:hypothetical protein